jgi:hypothetical protein
MRLLLQGFCQLGFLTRAYLTIVTDPLMSRRWAVFTFAESLVVIVSFLDVYRFLPAYKKVFVRLL